jgi:hypothetical protein
MVIKLATITLIKRAIGYVALLTVFVFMANSWLELNFLTPHERSFLAVSFVIGAFAVSLLSLIERSLVPQAQTPRPPQDPLVAARFRRRFLVAGVLLLVAWVALTAAEVTFFPSPAMNILSWLSALLLTGGVFCLVQRIFLAAKAR